jgi:hypothetical protein
MDVLVSLAFLVNLADVAKQFGGRTKCDCDRKELEKRPKCYMKIGYPGGDRFWCEECTNVPSEARYLNNAVCSVKECKSTTGWALNGTREDGLCGPHHKKLSKEEQALYWNVKASRCACGNLAINSIVPEGETHETTRPTHCGPCVQALPEEEQPKYEDVVSKRCACGKKQANNAIVPEGETRETTRPTHCGPCVRALPEEEREKYENVQAKRCERDECETFAHYAEDFKGFPQRFCGPHAPTHFVNTNLKLCCGPDDGIECPRNNTIMKNKSGGQCAWCDPNSNSRKYEFAVLDRLKERYGFVSQYKIYDAVNESERVRSRFIHAIDGAILFDGIVVAIEVDEEGHSRYTEEVEERRMRICEEYLEEEHGVDVTWIRIVPNIRGGKKVLGDGNDQFGEKAVAIRDKIISRAVAKINELLENPVSGVFYFKQE